MKKYFILPFALAVLSLPVFAQIAEEEQPCDPEVETCEEPEIRTDIYPFKPIATADIQGRVSRLTENADFLWDIREMTARGLTKAKTKDQPWGGPFWPLNQGQIANTYQDKDYDTFIFTLGKNFSWKHNRNLYQKRARKVHPKIYSLSESELAELAPSEKYDILLGDTTFDLTNRVWDFQEKWGSQKKWAFLSSIDLPAGYRIPEGNSFMAQWEGICHGWAVASGHSPRPEKTVWVTLPNNKRMPFYPNDIKALISLMWANSTIQDSVIVEGLRCNQKAPQKDKFGRFIDVKPDKNDETLLPRCADVHPAVYHASIVNILGIEGRSFVIDKSAKASIANQPVSGYQYVYFNPKNGKEGSLEASVQSVASYKEDPFKDSRSPEAKFIVGVAMTLSYVNWEFPRAKETNYPSDDVIKDMEFNYDLELNAEYKIIGGQWRVKRNGNGRVFGNNTHQPDFFWVVPRDYKQYFKPNTTLPEWDFVKSTLPPKEFGPAALGAHSFIYEVSKKYGSTEKCDVLPVGEGEIKKVDCEFRYPRPQPLINVVEKLLEISRK